MNDQELQTIFQNYLDAFANPTSAEQERLLRACAAEEIVFTNPGVEGRGLGNLLAHITRFQAKFPGGYFRVNSFWQQHGPMLAEWTQFNRDGSEFLTAHSYARLDDQHRITHFAGFWKV